MPLFLTILLTGLLGSSSLAESASTILHYDENGRVIERQRSIIDGEPRGDPGRPGPGGRGGTGPDGTPLATFETGEILATGVSAQEVRQARSLGFTPIERLTLGSLQFNVVRFRTPASAQTEDALRTFRFAFPTVTSDVNGLLVPAAREGWDAIRTIGWPELRAACGSGVRLGMIDTPVAVDHPAFLGQQVTHRSFLADDKQPALASHGTAVAALLVGSPDTDGFGGLLPQASLLAGSIFERRPGGRTVGNLFALLKAMEWMAEEHVDVLNLSLETGENRVLSQALDRAAAAGMVLTAAAGNGGAEARPAYPAAHPAVLAATALDPGLNPYRYANHGSYIDFAAPGVRLWTAVPGGGQLQSGTSFAVPFLTAVVAAQMSNGIDADPQEIRRSLLPGARDLGAPGKDVVFGWGLLRLSPTCR